jgi:NADH dehydrogenase
MARLEGKETPPFRGRLEGMFVALGGRYGAAEIFGIRFRGISAYYMKRFITFAYHFGINFRANAGYRIRRVER